MGKTYFHPFPEPSFCYNCGTEGDSWVLLEGVFVAYHQVHKSGHFGWDGAEGSLSVVDLIFWGFFFGSVFCS